MEPNQTFIEFIDQLKPGQIYKAHGYDILVIVDVLRSAFTPNIALYVRFIRNVGNARQYDILELTPERHLGVVDWQPATVEELTRAIEKRLAGLSRELGVVEEMVRGGEIGQI